MTNRPAPMTPAECDLQDFEFMPVMVRRLLKSETWSLGTGDERAAAVALWFESWHQVPAASLPSDDRLLKRLADSDRWAKVKAQALRGWVLCSDDRLYHPVVAEKALEAWIEKLLSGIAGASGNAKRWGLTINTAESMGQLQLAIGMLRVLAPQSKTLKKKAVVSAVAGITPGSPPDANASPPDSPPDRNRQGQGQGQGEGQGQGLGSDADASGGAGAPPPAGKVMTDFERRKSDAWKGAKSLLNAHGMPMDQTGAYLGKLHADYGTDAFLEVIEAAIVERPSEPEAWLKAACQRRAGERQGREPAWRTEQRERTQQAAPGVAVGAAPHSQFFIDVDARQVGAPALPN